MAVDHVKLVKPVTVVVLALGILGEVVHFAFRMEKTGEWSLPDIFSAFRKSCIYNISYYLSIVDAIYTAKSIVACHNRWKNGIFSAIRMTCILDLIVFQYFVHLNSYSAFLWYPHFSNSTCFDTMFVVCFIRIIPIPTKEHRMWCLPKGNN